VFDLFVLVIYLLCACSFEGHVDIFIWTNLFQALSSYSYWSLSRFFYTKSKKIRSFHTSIFQTTWPMQWDAVSKVYPCISGYGHANDGWPIYHRAKHNFILFYL